VAQHLKDQTPHPFLIGILENQMIVIIAQTIQILRRTRAGKAHPDIGPGIIWIGSIKSYRIGLNQKTLAGFQMVSSILHHIVPLSFQDIVNYIVRPHCWTKALISVTLLIAAKA